MSEIEFGLASKGNKTLEELAQKNDLIDEKLNIILKLLSNLAVDKKENVISILDEVIFFLKDK